MEIKGVFERIAVLKLKVRGSSKLYIIKAYAPTIVAEKKEMKDF